MKTCCEQMKLQLKDERVTISYLPRYRTYSIDVIDWYIPKDEIDTIKDSISARQNIVYCPWCGKRLPEDLTEKWFEVLKKEYGILHPFNKDKKRVPEEFKTDEWWKKRGL